MIIRIQSHRGDHNCEVADVDVAEKVFDKLTGRTSLPLSEEVRTSIPDTFQELEALFRTGTLSYMPVQKDGGYMTLVERFSPDLREVLFVAPIRGG